LVPGGRETDNTVEGGLDYIKHGTFLYCLKVISYKHFSSAAVSRDA